MRLIIISILIVVLMGLQELGFADIFSKPDNGSMYSVDTALTEDNSGFYYRGGVDYRPPVPAEDPEVGFSVLSGSMGCSGFDLASSFKSTFSEQALTDYLKGLSSGAIAAAPMLLLEYASPTLADIIKHFAAMTNMRLGLRYAQCEDIEKAAGEYMDKMRKKSESQCVKEKVGTGLDIDNALKQCKEGKDPFAFLKDINNVPLAQGGKINLLADVFKRINIPEERKQFATSIAGETTITSSQIEKNKGGKSIYSVNEEARSDSLNKLVLLLDEYEESQIINPLSLQELSLPNNPLTEEQIKDIALMPKAKRYIAASKIASDIAYFKTVNQCMQALDDLLEAMRAPGIDDVQREILQRDYAYLKEKLEGFKEERQLYRDYNQAMTGILSEAEREKLTALVNEDSTTSYFDEDAKSQNRKEMYIPNSEKN